MLSAPRHADLLVDPDAWWFEQRVLSRELIDIGEAGLAYRVAARHAASSPAAVADAEFHAGWYALGMLEKPHLAARHFHRIAEVADGPISRARAFYWLGRAAEAGGPGKADDLYAEAARYGTAFYGQLAAHALGHETIAIARPEPNAADRAAFAMRPAVWAIRRLQAVGHGERTGLIYRELARTLRRPGEIDLLAEMAENAGGPAAVLRLAKIAARRGLEIGALAHPVGAIPASARLSGAGRALAYAVARQESEFDPAAVSGAGARGLLQLMPATARDMARRAGLPFSSQRLVTDPGYNATLGATYLANQLDRFDGSYILTLVAYNAGPRRAHDWMARYGDPRGRDLAAVIDWLERIPFTETRNYVQRVMENYQVYRMQLTGQADIGGALGEGRR
jgi:soluble lytic murein transglycosylase